MKFIYYSDEKYQNINCVVDIKNHFVFHINVVDTQKKIIVNMKPNIL